MLSTKPGKEAYVEPVIENDGYRFAVNVGKPRKVEEATNGTKLGRGANFRCVMSGTPISGDYIKAEGKAGRMSARLMAIVAEGAKGRVYLAPSPEHERAARMAKPEWRPEGEIPTRMTGGNCTPYGLTTWGDLFTSRQLVALTTFSDLVGEAMQRVREDSIAAGLADDATPLRDGGTAVAAYADADAVGVYLGLSLDKMTDTNTCLCSWQVDPPRLRATFGRQALPMVWDYAEANIFGDAAGDYARCVTSLCEVLDKGGLDKQGSASQSDVQRLEISAPRTFSTDPPYYDNIGYADLSDFFYIWLRRTTRRVFPDLFETLATPKTEELVATPYRHGGKDKAEAFFLRGMAGAMQQIAHHAHPGYPLTMYYAFKQAETESREGIWSTGWETFLEAVIRAGLAVRQRPEISFTDRHVVE
jgi:putative DNA methylase